MYSILLVEDHATFASVLVRMLGLTKNLHVAAVVKRAEAALKELQTQTFDLVLVDVALPEMNGISLVGLIHDLYPDLPCLMLSGHTLGHYVNRALAAGARGYILKDDTLAIVEGIQQVLRGEIYVSKKLRRS
jgi:DNA-binding NarL/FixJ family response regulator